MSFPTHGLGGASSFHGSDHDDGATKCVDVAMTKKKKRAFAFAWADSTFFPPAVGAADSTVESHVDVEEQELGGCCE